jgi:hypothetical protein
LILPERLKELNVSKGTSPLEISPPPFDLKKDSGKFRVKFDCSFSEGIESSSPPRKDTLHL